MTSGYFTGRSERKGGGRSVGVAGVRRALVLVALVMLGVPTAHAAPRRFAPWADNSALGVAPGRVELGVFSESAWGVNDRLELRVHPLAFFALPHVEAKLRLLDRERWQLASRHRLSYPTWFMQLVAREGVGGLLPHDAEIPQALLIDQDLLGSVEWLRGHWLTAHAGFSVAPRTANPEWMLDFPFLYQRFAALHSLWVPRVGLGANGAFAWWVGYQVDVRQRWLGLDAVPGATAVDTDLALYLHPGYRHRIALGLLVSRALLPVGERSHHLPYLDYRIAF